MLRWIDWVLKNCSGMQISPWNRQSKSVSFEVASFIVSLKKLLRDYDLVLLLFCSLFASSEMYQVGREKTQLMNSNLNASIYWILCFTWLSFTIRVKMNHSFLFFIFTGHFDYAWYGTGWLGCPFSYLYSDNLHRSYMFSSLCDTAFILV